MKNSIEEDIKIAERFIKSIKTDKEYKKEGWHGYFNEEIVELARILQHILSDYKRVLKENELLKKDIEGWKKYCEEIEEEQTEMSNKNCELEFEIEKLQKENEELKNQEATARRINELLVQRYSNSIPVQKVKDLIDRIDYDIKKTKEIISNNSNIYTSGRKNDYQIVRLRAMNTKSLDIKKRLQKLLESEE